MSNHPIEGLMKTTMESLKQMVDVNTIVGDPVETPDKTVIIPISKVTFGFASGGGECNLRVDQESDEEISKEKRPFAGGTGAGISVKPVAFLVVENGQTKLLQADQNASIIENLINFAPKFLDKIQSMVEGKSKNKEENKNKGENETKKE